MSRKRVEFLPGAMISGIPLTAMPEAPRKVLRPKQGWPDWPFFLMNERSMDSLREIASRLNEKVAHRRTGIIGDMTPVERQMYEHISELRQDVGELNDAFQASLQIIDDNRTSQRVKRTMTGATELWKAVLFRLRNSTALTVLGALGSVLLVVTILRYVIHLFQR
jgi:hypothetical protein